MVFKMYKAKNDFLWYKPSEEIKEEDLCHCGKWEKEGLVELVKPIIKKVAKKKIAKKKIVKRR